MGEGRPGAPSRSLLDPLPPLARREKLFLLGSAVLVAATRLVALARGPWDWDEMLFSSALVDYDVGEHHPHPPGFPVYVAIAKALQLVVGDEFRALQSANLLAAVLLYPALFALGRELGLGFGRSLVAALIFTLMPNVWLYGGTGFSDIPSITLAVAAVACLVRGCRSRRAYWLGALLLALAAGIRPQNLVLGIVPALLATWHRLQRRLVDPLVALGIGAGTLGLVTALAAHFTGSWDRFWWAVQDHRAYVLRVDSFRSPTRPPLPELLDDFFVAPHGARLLGWIVLGLGIISLARLLRPGRRPVALVLLTFGPLALMGWLVFDRYGVSRLSIGYLPLLALLAAEGIWTASGPFGRFGDRARLAVVGSMAGALLMLSAVRTHGALKVVRTTDSPPVAAARWIRERLPTRQSVIVVAPALRRHAERLLPGFQLRLLGEGQRPPLEPLGQAVYLMVEDRVPGSRNVSFNRERDDLWPLVRQRFFDVTVVPLSDAAFGEGWYGPESLGRDTWRWMGRRSVTTLGAVEGRARLSLDFEIASEEASVFIVLNDGRLDRFTPARRSERRTYLVRTRTGGAPNRLVMEVDKVVVPKQLGRSADDRSLGIKLRGIAWEPASALP